MHELSELNGARESITGDGGNSLPTSNMKNRPVRRRFSLVRSCVAFAVAAGGLLTAETASAQGWMADRRYTEGAGIKAGDLELHPGIGGEIGYDSNWFLRSFKQGPTIANGAPALPPREGAILRITPSFSIATTGPQRSADAAGRIEPRIFNFRGGVSATYREFFGHDELRRQRNVGLNADLRADINQGRPIGFAVFAGYQRLIQPNVVADPNLSFNRSDIKAGAEIIAIPGGGTLDLRLAYQLYAALFEESQGVPYTNITHEIAARNRWRFRPRTALFHDTSLRFINYPNADRAALFLSDSTPLRTRVGLTGLITDRIGTLLAVGYGASFFNNTVVQQQYDSVNAQAEGTYYLSQGAGTDQPGEATLLLSTFTLGVSRDFQNSLLGNFYNSNRLYARLEYWFGGKMVITVSGYGEQQNYPSLFLGPGAGGGAALGPDGAPIGDFTNYRVNGALFAEYRFTDAIGVNTTFDYTQVISNTQIPTGGVAAPGAPGTFFDLNWRRVQAFVGARVFF